MSDIAFHSSEVDFTDDSKVRKQFEHFFKTHYSDLCRFVYGYVKSREVARDIVQSVFLKVWEQKNLWDDYESAKAYLYQSVRNEALNYKKHQRVKEAKHSEIRLRISEWKENYNNSEIQNKKKKLIQKGISQLPERCQEIFRLSRETGLTYKEIADVLELSIKTVETQMGRAFKSLRTFVKKHRNQILLLGTLFLDI